MVLRFYTHGNVFTDLIHRLDYNVIIYNKVNEPTRVELIVSEKDWYRYKDLDGYVEFDHPVQKETFRFWIFGGQMSPIDQKYIIICYGQEQLYFKTMSFILSDNSDRFSSLQNNQVYFAGSTLHPDFIFNGPKVRLGARVGVNMHPGTEDHEYVVSDYLGVNDIEFFMEKFTDYGLFYKFSSFNDALIVDVFIDAIGKHLGYLDELNDVSIEVTNENEHSIAAVAPTWTYSSKTNDDALPFETIIEDYFHLNVNPGDHLDQGGYIPENEHRLAFRTPGRECNYRKPADTLMVINPFIQTLINLPEVTFDPPSIRLTRLEWQDTTCSNLIDTVDQNDKRVYHVPQDVYFEMSDYLKKNAQGVKISINNIKTEFGHVEIGDYFSVRDKFHNKIYKVMVTEFTENINEPAEGSLKLVQIISKNPGG